MPAEFTTFDRTGSKVTNCLGQRTVPRVAASNELGTMVARGLHGRQRH